MYDDMGCLQVELDGAQEHYREAILTAAEGTRPQFFCVPDFSSLPVGRVLALVCCSLFASFIATFPGARTRRPSLICNFDVVERLS